jgi:hypothetical protein
LRVCRIGFGWPDPGLITIWIRRVMSFSFR